MYGPGTACRLILTQLHIRIITRTDQGGPDRLGVTGPIGFPLNRLLFVRFSLLIDCFRWFLLPTGPQSVPA
jgi:hypothetical protein